MVTETMKEMIETASASNGFDSSSAYFVLGIPEYWALLGEFSGFSLSAIRECEEFVNLAYQTHRNVPVCSYLGIRLEISDHNPGVRLVYGPGWDRKILVRNPLKESTPSGPSSHEEEKADSQSELVLVLVDAIRDVLNQIEEVVRG